MPSDAAQQEQSVAVATPQASSVHAPTRLRIEFLFLDLTTCTRCRGTDRSLEVALQVVGDLLAAASIEVVVEKIHVESAEQARALRFLSSPTIRVNDRDVALELRESSCGSEACTDGCGDSIACRVWVHRGREYTEPPVEMIVDAILREVYAEQDVGVKAQEQAYELPENLERFFAGKAEAVVPAATACCSPADQATCCEAEDKVECCGTATVSECGCR
jgi:Domain of unknown function (DUF2703)